VDWILLTYRLPAEPSRHRVAVWRELRKVGALSLQQATWALPARRDFADAVSRAIALIERAGGDALVFDAVPQGDATGARLDELFSAAREEEWTEFVAECGKFEQEIEKEIRTQKFTAAELDEEEQTMAAKTVQIDNTPITLLTGTSGVVGTPTAASATLVPTPGRLALAA